MRLGQSRAFRRAAAWAPAGLAAGFLLGAFSQELGLSTSLTDWAGSLGNLWTRALQLAVLPLLAGLLVSGIGGMEAGRGLGRWGLASIASFLTLLLAGGLLAYGFSIWYVEAWPPSTLSMQSILADGPEPAQLTVGSWIESLLPSNLFQAAANGEMLPITLATILFALAIRTLPQEPRKRLVEVFTALRDAVLTYLGWVLLLMPVGAFLLAYAISAKTGLEIAGSALSFIGLSAGLLLAATFLLYPIVALLGRLSPLRFAKAAFPTQVLAVSSRSSLACLPGLVRAAEDLELPEPASEFVLPLATSVFKPNRTVSSLAKLIFVAALFDIHLSPGAILSFGLTVVVLSISTPGLPSMGTRITFGAYLAAGLPPGGIMLFEALDPLIDVFKTLYNATANLAVAVVVSRFSRGEPAAVEGFASQPV